MKIIICGDLHGNWKYINNLIENESPQIILQCGDFGFFPNICKPCGINPKDTKIYFCDGNHDNHWNLKNLENPEISNNIFYAKRGSILELPVDGRRVLFMGGADSIDKQTRTLGVDWFPEEVISNKDIDDLFSTKIENIDIVVSHTCPIDFNIKMKYIIGKTDPSRLALSYILHELKPKLWFFSHWHIFSEGRTLGCDWFCLDQANKFNSKWWKKLT